MSDKKNNTAEIGERLYTDLAPEQVKDYLLANPDFFVRYPLVIEELTIPHAKKGSVSLVEIQSEQLREKVKELQNKISQLMSVAKQNERIYRIYADLHLSLFHCKTVSDVVQALENSVKDELGLTSVILKLVEGEKAWEQANFDELEQHRFRGKSFFFGRLTKEENDKLFDNDSVKSVALLQLKHEKVVGLLAFGSEEDGHFYPEMDTLLINQLQQFLSLLIPQLMKSS